MAESTSKQGVTPEKHNDIYDAISPAKLAGTLRDKVCFVTGAGRGIGKAISLAFAEAGAHVAILSRTKSELDEVAQIITSKFDRKALVFVVDATDTNAVESAFKSTESKLGKVDVVVPNAASFLYRPYVYTPFEDWWKMMEVNIKGPMFLTQLAMKSMRERNEGIILLISSRAGVLNLTGPSGYCVSKTALIRAASCLQLELDAEGKSGIQLFSLHPGGVKTQMAMSHESFHEDMDKLIPGFCQDIFEKRPGMMKDTPELCAWTCVYLASGKAKEIRGRYIDVENDIETVLTQHDVVQREKLYDLGVKELGGA